MEAVFVAEGEVVEQVFDGEDAAFGEAGGDAVADALDEFNGGGELERHGFDGSSGDAGESVGRGEGGSRFPEGMTERQARARNGRQQVRSLRSE